MKKHRCYFIVILLLFISCKNSNSDSIIIDDKSFSKITELKSEVISGITQLNPSNICVFDEVLMITDWRESPRFHFYNKNNLEKITEYGYIGNAQEEFKNPECNCQTFSNKSNEKVIMISEFGYGLIYNVNLSYILQKRDSTKIISQDFLNPQISDSDNLFRIDDNVFGEAVFNNDIKYFSTSIYDFNVFQRKGTLNQNAFLKKVELDERKNIDRSFLSYSKNRKKFIAAYLQFNYIKILNEDMEELSTIYYGSREKNPKSISSMSGENLIYFSDVFTGDKYFYVLYSGVSMKNDDGKREIHVYDYVGNPIYKYSLDVPVSKFTIDEKTNTIYAITGLDQSPIVKFKFND